MTEHPHKVRFDRLDRLSRQLDSAFRIPGTRFRLGFDTLVGLIPGVGDVATMLPAAWILLESHRMGLPRERLLRQGINVAIDGAVGSIPLIGDLFDAGFKANRRNVEILRAHLEGDAMRDVTPPGAPGAPPR